LLSLGLRVFVTLFYFKEPYHNLPLRIDLLIDRLEEFHGLRFIDKPKEQRLFHQGKSSDMIRARTYNSIPPHGKGIIFFINPGYTKIFVSDMDILHAAVS